MNKPLKIDFFLVFWITSAIISISLISYGIIPEKATPLIASALTASGTLYAALYSLRRNDEMKTKEREMLLKKEIYLPLIEHTSKGISAMAQLWNVDKTDEDVVWSFIGDSSCYSKAYLIADISTIESIAQLTDQLSQSYIKLIPQRNILKQATSYLQQQEEQLKKYSDKDVSTLNEQQKIYHDNYILKLDDSIEKKDKPNFETLKRELIYNIVNEVENLIPTATTLFGELRRELGAPMNKEEIEIILRKTIIQNKATIPSPSPRLN